MKVDDVKFVELRNQFNELEETIENVMEQMGEDGDMAGVARIGEKVVSGWKNSDKANLLIGLQAKRNELETRCLRLASEARGGKPPFKMIHAGPGGIGPNGGATADGKSLGENVIGDSGFKAWIDSGKAGTWGSRFDVSPIAHFRKTLFETTAGWAPQSVRTGVVTDAVTRPIQLLDIIPVQRTSSEKILWMLETTRTHNAAEKAEGAAFAESVFTLAEQTSTVRKITDSLPVTDEQLEDEGAAERYINGRLMFGVKQRLDAQIMNGSGTGVNLEGILNVTGIQTQALAADNVPDAIHKAMTKIAVTGRSAPSHIVLHPTDAESMRLLTTADGNYLMGRPSMTGPPTLWGLPLVVADVIAVGTALVGSFMPEWVTLWERRGIDIQIGYTGTQFIEGKRTVRADGRWALTVQRPAAFCTVTGL